VIGLPFFGTKEGQALQKLVGVALILCWGAYVATTAYVAWRVASGDPPSFISNYTLGTNAAWVMVGIMLWLATEWMRGFRG
jgi:hypothetical protein